jgi:signal transduction histidine kinase
LIVNAAHAIADVNGAQSSQRGTIKISSSLAGSWAEIRISDSGPGIPEEIRHRVFDLFFTTKEPGRGTGQGLAIAHSVIVDKHGGTIDIESEENRGTTFVIRLPVDENYS